jgi:hypothetical protein
MSYKMQHRQAVLQRRLTLGTQVITEKSGYQGDRHGKSYLSQHDNLPDHLNCSLWITNISTSVTPSTFVSHIACGKIYALSFNHADTQHSSQAAKLVFCHPESAAYFYGRAKRGGIWLGNERIVVRYNRKGTRRFAGSQSRVLRVTGPEGLMTLEEWIGFFRGFCDFDLSTARAVDRDTASVTYEFHFLRVDGQAQMCFKGIIENPHLRSQVQVSYGVDPCEGRIE